MRFSAVLALAVIPIPHLLPLLQLLPPPPNSHFPAVLVFVAVLLGMGFISSPQRLSLVLRLVALFHLLLPDLCYTEIN